jgi:FtsP/CotA-like multicopper oxidase with cupredoxin domain
MALRFEGHAPLIVALDGQPCEPHAPTEGRILLGPAMRADVMLDMQGDPGRRYRVVDDFYGRLAYTLVELAYDTAPASARRAPCVCRPTGYFTPTSPAPSSTKSACRAG